MRVELLYFDDCPSYERLLPRLRALVDAHAPSTEIELRRIDSQDAAERERFLGSPTVLVDGEDVDPSASARTDFGLKCRLYRTADGYSQTPAEELIVAAINRATPDQA